MAALGIFQVRLPLQIQVELGLGELVSQAMEINAINAPEDTRNELKI